MTPDPLLVDWLLASEIPTIRYLTYRDVLGRPAGDPDLTIARQAIMETGPVPAILSHQEEHGAWAGQNNYYQPKYFSTHWSMTLLTELHIDGQDPRFQRGVDYMLTTLGPRIMRDLEEGKTGFSCFWGNLLRYTFHAGRGDEAVVQTMLEYAARDLRTGCSCLYNWQLACGWGVARTLWGLGNMPAATRSAELQAAIDGALDFLLVEHDLAQANYPTNEEEGQTHPLWFRLNFPLFYQVDILFVLRVLAEYNGLDRPGAQPALAWLANKQRKNGRWSGSSPYRRRTYPEMGESPETNRWVSLFSASILQIGPISGVR